MSEEEEQLEERLEQKSSQKRGQSQVSSEESLKTVVFYGICNNQQSAHRCAAITGTSQHDLSVCLGGGKPFFKAYINFELMIPLKWELKIEPDFENWSPKAVIIDKGSNKSQACYWCYYVPAN